MKKFTTTQLDDQFEHIVHFARKALAEGHACVCCVLTPGHDRDDYLPVIRRLKRSGYSIRYKGKKVNDDEIDGHYYGILFVSQAKAAQ